ncbi:hypothetical protein SPBRAN_403 [uncultured Candidatus Thioglobus sp.]|nr:hypothetical protein SPBRAN_403 [uncultured Candidatus Thioglobus sp.]
MALIQAGKSAEFIKAVFKCLILFFRNVNFTDFLPKDCRIIK